ncbi:hypothetical protein Msil_2778 [Methylocella silvestris BL2]|uniref:Uncharacterized protein n=1 Tax=Methylocella silvestris (strain DSM 15510 / CIP 108128 / LMG 27833 / NCIMB 13906 / BL2) TaxID=395965 RepID=B8ERZ9_METSB|nr:hypothetical protein [Methylocella silvestris]ACK51697.1 hypothetical protein Msil_2778 [Methylocella silvestris BL2]
MKLMIGAAIALLASSQIAAAQNTNPTGQSRNDAGAGEKANTEGGSTGAAAGQDGLPSSIPPGANKPSGQIDKGKGEDAH